MLPRYSLIIPVYNRPEEIAELLESISVQTFSSFEVIIIEDGSDKTCESVVAQYQNKLEIQYIKVPNGGPSQARNKGSRLAKGEYLIILDSDVVLPNDYLSNIEHTLEGAAEEGKAIEAFGGPDTSSEDFSKVQKAINYSMTSFVTTGGIRGGKKRITHYYPRSFNLGCRKSVFEELNGFDETMRYGEDLDFSMRLHKTGARTVLIPSAFVYHKRRVSFGQFFRQVHKFGAARIAITQKHKGSLRLIHLLPSIATIGIVLLLLGGFFCPWSWGLLLLLILIFFFDSLRLTKSFSVALLAVPASFIQVVAYGTGLIKAFLLSLVRK